MMADVVKVAAAVSIPVVAAGGALFAALLIFIQLPRLRRVMSKYLGE